MSLSPATPVSGKSDVLSPLLSAFIIVMFLFFIDEGYYDFRWMAEPGNWLVFAGYLLIFFLLQYLIALLLFRKITGWKKLAAMVIIAVPVTIGFLWLLI